MHYELLEIDGGILFAVVDILNPPNGDPLPYWRFIDSFVVDNWVEVDSYCYLNPDHCVEYNGTIYCPRLTEQQIGLIATV